MAKKQFIILPLTVPAHTRHSCHMMKENTDSQKQRGPALACWTSCKVGADILNPSDFFVSHCNNVFALFYLLEDKSYLCRLAIGNVHQWWMQRKDVSKSREDLTWHNVYRLPTYPAH